MCRSDPHLFDAVSFSKLEPSEASERTLEDWLPLAIRELECEAKDGPALNAIGKQMLPFLEAFIRKLDLNVEDVEEAANEALAVMLAKLAEFNPRAGSFKGWGAGIARNIVRGKLRHQQRKEKPYKTEYDAKRADKLHLKRRPTQDQKVELLEAILNMPDEDQRLLEMLLLERMAAGAAAKVLKISSDLARTKKSRRLKELGEIAGRIIGHQAELN